MKRKHILEVAKTIEDRLAELDAEKEELAKYQQLDKQIRSLEYTIFDKELVDAKHELEKVSALLLLSSSSAKWPGLHVLSLCQLAHATGSTHGMSF